ncbi:MAG: hypothetical protein ACPLXO_04495 [Desulfurella sp.]|jgi:hypothetical protein|uniref:Uncharacterized protein n=1 Tax=Desulfurella multipotens TaxID=79269 RepID=A0A1G6IYH5_9BACT|nr:hypothetical protein [Desulfurella multipotens]SDC11554.1 hypothetical protein SAMN05660835_00339 [Desulfurella multipotens]
MIKKAILCLVVFFYIDLYQVLANEIYVIPNVALILPKNSSISSYWVVNPIDFASKENAGFCITNQAVVGYMEKFVFFPNHNSIVQGDGGHKGFVCFGDQTLAF